MKFQNQMLGLGWFKAITLELQIQKKIINHCKKLIKSKGSKSYINKCNNILKEHQNFLTFARVSKYFIIYIELFQWNRRD